MHRWDFALLKEKILIEADGCYWHGCKKHTTEERRGELVEFLKKEDLRDLSAEFDGWLVLRFWQCDIRERSSDIERTILSVIQHQRKLVA